MMSFAESDIEDALLTQLKDLGYATAYGPDVSPEGASPKRTSHGEAILTGLLRSAVTRLNPDIPEDARHDAINKVLATDRPNLTEENHRLHTMLAEGVPVEFYGADGAIRGDAVRLIDPDTPDANDWLAVNQFTVIESSHGRREKSYNRRIDIVVFVNGLPLAVVELKRFTADTDTLHSAFNQLQTYKANIPSLFRTNAALIISNGMKARIGSLTAEEDRFMPWRSTDGLNPAPGMPEMTVLIDGVFEKQNFLSLLHDFITFRNTGSGYAKIIAGYHQVSAVRHAVETTIRAAAADGDRKAGVIWHTQGSGKSLLMAFYAGQLVRHPKLENPTLLLLTDRNDLDNQLFTTFAQCRELIRQTPVQARSRTHLRRLLNQTAGGGVIFSTIQKFTPEDDAETLPSLTDRRNVIVIADEAHRSQYGFKARIDKKTGGKTYGFAKHIRDALPNASFIGFTGTPIEKDDASTPAVFGDYVDVYDISRAVEDGATVPIYYESRLARLRLDENETPKIDDEIKNLTEEEKDESAREQIKRKWATIEALVGSKKRLKMVAKDLVQHFKDRNDAKPGKDRNDTMPGKAMIVCMSRRICVALYQEITALQPDWHSPNDNDGIIKIVMTGAASDPPDWQEHIGNKSRRDMLARRFKDPDDSLAIVIVCDMWLTGFDVPPMHTMYIDKPMRGHNLMQAIARVNRVFGDKQGGLVVDYIGIAHDLRSALGRYSRTDRNKTGVDAKEAEDALQEAYEIVKDMLHGFDYTPALDGTPQVRLSIIAAAMEWILDRQHKAAEAETTKDGKKHARRRFQDAVLDLSKAFTLAAASDTARKIRDEAGLFQAIRDALTDSSRNGGGGGGGTGKEHAIRQIIDRSVLSGGIVDILAAAGLNTQNVSILSDEFLAGIQDMPQKNLALEALRRLLNSEIRSRGKINVVEEKSFSDRLAQAMARYHANAISTVEVIQELINLARDIRAARHRGEEEGLSDDEIAFYDALAENKSAVKVMGNDSLKVIAHELLTSLRGNISVDWAQREDARARMRMLVKRILRQHGYPPDLQDSAVQTVLRQAEVLSAHWVA